jgi:alpha-ketoglutarate-dependent taurine dioxygenase
MDVMTTTAIELHVRPLSPTIGAEILGVDCSADLPDAVVAAIREVWLERLVVFFPGQHLDDGTQVTFARRFGELTESHPVEAR